MLAAGGSVQAQQWPDAPAEARPGTRWWWLGSAVDEKNLTYNLEEYARAGMGTVEITPIYGVQGMTPTIFSFFLPDGWKCSNIHKRKESAPASRST